MARLTHLLPSTVAVAAVIFVGIGLLPFGTSPIVANNVAVDKAKIRDAVTDLKITTMKINQMMASIDKQVNQSSHNLDRQMVLLENNHKLQTHLDSTGLESDFALWHADYIAQVEQEGYYIQRSNIRVNHLASSHAQSLHYIDDIVRQNNELFNLFTPPRSKSLIQQNDILNFKLSLQKQVK